MMTTDPDDTKHRTPSTLPNYAQRKYRARIAFEFPDDWMDSYKPGVPTKLGCGLAFTLLVVLLSQLISSLAHWRVTYLPLVVVSVFPCLVIATMASILDSIGKRNERSPSALPDTEPNANGAIAEPDRDPPGDGKMGWVTARGCQVEAGPFYAWEWLKEPQWGPEDGSLTSVSFLMVRQRARGVPIWLPWRAAVLLLGPIASTYLAIRYLPRTGIQEDFLAVLALNLMLIGVVAMVNCFSNRDGKGWAKLRLRVQVHADQLSRAELEAIMNHQAPDS